MKGAIAAGHPLTAQTGATVLAEGGNAVDACIAAAFAAAVAEGPLTGPTGGGFLLVHSPDGQTTLLDCFFAVPEGSGGEMEEIVIDFEDAGTQTFHVGEASVAVPGLVPGLEEAHRRFGSHPWASLVEPAIELAEGGIARDEPRDFLHRLLGGILLRTDAGARVYGHPERIVTHEFSETLERLRDVGSRAVVELMPELAYERSAAGPPTGTTHISVVDADGVAASLSSTLGSGSGVFRGGTQLNNMLGELDVIGAGPQAPGERLPSMMTPTMALAAGAPRLVVGSAGSVRLAGAIAQVAWRVLEGESVSEAIDAPRIHVQGTKLHLEGGWAEDAIRHLADSWEPVRWVGRNLFFGGVSAVERLSDGSLAAAGDPRRG